MLMLVCPSGSITVPVEIKEKQQTSYKLIIILKQRKLL